MADDPFAQPDNGTAGALTLADFLDRFSEVDEEANGYAVICPSHDDSTPTLRVIYNADRKLIGLKCRAGCKTTDVVKALDLKMADLFNVEPGDLSDIRTAGGIPQPVGIAHRAALVSYLDKAAADLTGHDAEMSGVALEYAEHRFGISRERALSLGLGVDGGTITSGVVVLSHALYRDTPRLVVPFPDLDGHPHYLQARALDRHYKGRAKWSGPANPDGASWGRYGWFPGDLPWDEVIVTEGPGDGLTSVGAGYDTLLIRGAAIGLTDDVLSDLAHRFPDKTFVLAGDNDRGGRQFNAIVGERLASAGLTVHVLTIPTGDLSDWREADPDAFYPALTEAISSAPAWEAPSVSESVTADAPRTAPAPSLQFTELANARRLVRRMDGRLRYSGALGFLIWNGSAWEQDRVNAVRAAAQESAEALVTEALEHPEGARREEMLKWAVASQRSQGIDAVIKEAKALPGVAVNASDLDAKPDLLTVRNGTIDLRTGALRPADPADLLTVALDINYDPDAPATRWLKFLDECFPGESDMVDYLRRLVGYGITGHAREQCYVMLHGRGGNGKSVFTSALYDTFRAVTKSVPIETFLAAGGATDGSSASSDVAALRGARIVLTSEAEAGARMADAKLKRLTGGDPVTARHLYHEPFTFFPSFLLFMSTNAIPENRDNSDGIWRRLKIIEWKQQFKGSRKDARLPDKLRAERAGILAWAVRGAVEWYKLDSLGEPGAVTATVNEHRAESDKLLEFYPGVITDDDDGWIARADLYSTYKAWTEQEGNHAWQPRTLYDELRARGVVQSSRKGNRGFKGIRPRRPSEKDADQRAQAAEQTHLSIDTDHAPDLATFIP